jgi:hypothetical protein
MLRNTSLRVNVSSHRYAHIMHAGHGVAQRASEDGDGIQDSGEARRF